jgi:hypothetical protein
MKEFKNEFGVEGSTSLIKAFKAEVESLGWIYDENFTRWDDLSNRDNPLLYFCVDDNSTMKRNHFSLSACDNKERIFILPQDWSKALELASEVEETIPEYVKCTGNGMCGNSFVYDRIYKLESGSTSKRYNIRRNDGDIRDYLIKGGLWIWIPSSKAEFDAQEKRLKEEALLKEAKLKYPIGTIFKVVHRPDIIYKVTSHDKHENTFVTNRTNLHINLLGEVIEGEKSSSKSGSVYMNGKQAEIVEDGFKVGDYITILKTIHGGGFKTGTTHKIMNVCPGNYLVGGKSNSWYYESEEFRKATPEEIQAASKKSIKIAGYEAEFSNGDDGDGYVVVSFGCKKNISQSDVYAIEGVMELSKRLNLDIKFYNGELKIENDVVSEDTISELIEKLD